MRYRFEFRPYRRPFRQPLHTHHGLWSVREGIVLRLSDAAAGKVALGEIAPIDWLGSESLTEALAFCQRLPNYIDAETIGKIPAHLPACQFGFESACEQWVYPEPTQPVLRVSHLLPTGAAALSAWRSIWQSGCTTFKWKIAVTELSEELQIFHQLRQALPPEATLRLDANGGLNWNSACRWLDLCENQNIEFLEQPLPVDQFDAMLKLSQRYRTPIALDESATTVAQLKACYRRGWRGIFVVKAAIAGSPWRLRAFCQNPDVDIVWSSALETAIARQFIQTRLIAKLPQHNRAIGFGVDQWFADDWNSLDFVQRWHTL
jgi:O-succinylbenzoate synthase